VDRERDAADEPDRPQPVTDGSTGRDGQGPILDLSRGQVIAKRYRLDEELGRGGMGVVWAATHLVTRRRVAIKFVRGPSDLRTDLRRRFLREARAASAVIHPSVVEVLDVFELDNETPVMVMELLSGETLRERLTREKKLTLAQTVTILLPVVAAVGSAHTLGIVHRDLKPENIFLVQTTGAGERVKVLDFGIAKLMGGEHDEGEAEPITGTGSMLGTPCYMAPEQTLGEKNIDPRADIWSLGVILYECLAGVRPVQGLGIGQVVLKLATEGIVPLGQAVPDLPEDVTVLVARMLARGRADRPNDLREAHDVLSRFAQGDSQVFPPTVISRRAPPAASSAPASLAPAPIVDTPSAQAMTGPSRSTSRGPLFAGVSALAVLSAVAGWQWISPPSRVHAVPDRPAQVVAAPVAQPAPSPAVAAEVSSPSSPAPAPASADAQAPAQTEVRTTKHAGHPALAPTPASAPAPAPASPPAPTGGLVEKPPF